MNIILPDSYRNTSTRNRNPILMPHFSPFAYNPYSKTSKNADKNKRSSRLSSNGSKNEDYEDSPEHDFVDNR